MKTSAILSFALLTALTGAALAQGSLTPPAGAPAPVMKTLDEIWFKAATVEAQNTLTNAQLNNALSKLGALAGRIPLVAGQPGVTVDAGTGAITIGLPGSYFLTGNLGVASGDAITIASSGVTLDLNGFTISSTSAANVGAGILLLNGPKDITISNGHIRGAITFDSGTNTYSGAGFLAGIGSSGGVVNPQNVLFSEISVSGCTYGISVGAAVGVARSCTVRSITNNGISCQIVDQCTASECGGTALFGRVVSNSEGASTGTGSGIGGVNVSNSIGNSVSGPGIDCTSASNVVGVSTSGIGLRAQTAQNSFGRTTSGNIGLSATGTASFCRGQNSAGGGVAIEAAIAIGCTAAAGTIVSPQKHLGTP